VGRSHHNSFYATKNLKDETIIESTSSDNSEKEYGLGQRGFKRLLSKTPCSYFKSCGLSLSGVCAE
jgi:hypothetical protein